MCDCLDSLWVWFQSSRCPNTPQLMKPLVLSLSSQTEYMVITAPETAGASMMWYIFQSLLKQSIEKCISCVPRDSIWPYASLCSCLSQQMRSHQLSLPLPALQGRNLMLPIYIYPSAVPREDSTFERLYPQGVPLTESGDHLLSTHSIQLLLKVGSQL